MTLEHIYYIGQTVAVVAVLGTLITLVVQMRRAENLTRVEITRAVATEATNLQLALFNSPEAAAFMHRALYTSEPLTDAETLRFSLSMNSLLVSLEVAWMMAGRGFVESITIPRTQGTIREYMSSPRARSWWKGARNTWFAPNPYFCAFVDRLVASAEQAEREAPDAS
ncbi:DUF6082 family protein [uncultured Parvibaculum sp.]|uniref:DUF6082 family protein n=1 Tax=uncultured Parvibaculum sp. TaxID=291828 RepID=UPI0030DC37E9